MVAMKRGKMCTSNLCNCVVSIIVVLLWLLACAALLGVQFHLLAKVHPAEKILVWYSVTTSCMGLLVCLVFRTMRDVCTCCSTPGARCRQSFLARAICWFHHFVSLMAYTTTLMAYGSAHTVTSALLSEDTALLVACAALMLINILNFHFVLEQFGGAGDVTQYYKLEDEEEAAATTDAQSQQKAEQQNHTEMRELATSPTAWQLRSAATARRENERTSTLTYDKPDVVSEAEFTSIDLERSESAEPLRMSSRSDTIRGDTSKHGKRTKRKDK